MEPLFRWVDLTSSLRIYYLQEIVDSSSALGLNLSLHIENVWHIFVTHHTLIFCTLLSSLYHTYYAVYGTVKGSLCNI